MPSSHTLILRESQETYSRSTKSQDGLMVSEALFWEKYYNDPDRTYEWRNGKLEEKPMSDPLNYWVHKWFLKLLDEFLEVHPIAKTTGLEIGFRLVLPNETVIRRPDLGLVLDENPVPLKPTGKTYEGIFDICVESVSDSDEEQVERDTIAKKWEYAKAGVTEYYVLDANRKHTACYRLNARGVYMPIKPTTEGIIKSKVLPGFQFQLEDLYAQPTAEAMSYNPVYQGFVARAYQQERKARQEAEAEIARLKALLAAKGTD